MRPKSHALSSFFILLLTAIMTVPALAQNLGSLHFLETFAMRLYERGDTTQAKKEFERILTIDPENLLAKKYLSSSALETASQPASMSNLNAIAMDIATLRANVLTAEKETVELEHTIRLLTGENDNLYTALRKRSRDLAELRAQMKDTPYYDEYAELMKALPPDRVPQDLLSSRDLLPASLHQAPDANDAIPALTRAIAQYEQDLSTLATSQNRDAQQIMQMQTALEAKRALLVEKNLLLIEKTTSLTQIKDDLSGMNVRLKDADHRYGNMLTTIDKINRELRAELAAQRTSDEIRYRELLADYAARVRELELLKTQAISQTTALSTKKPELEKQDAAIAKIDAAVAVKDQDLQKYIRLLEQYKSELAQKDAKLTETIAVIAEKETLLVKSHALLNEKDSSLNDKNKIIAEKESVLAQKDSVISEKEATIASKEQVLTQKDDLIKNVRTELLAKDAVITEHATTIAKQSADLNVAGSELNAVGAQISTIEALLKANDRDIADLRSGISRMKETMRTTQAATAKAQGLKERLSRLERGLTRLESPGLLPADETFAAHFRRSEDALAATERELIKTRDQADSLTEHLAAKSLIIEKLQLENARLRDQSPTTDVPEPNAGTSTAQPIIIESPRLSAEVITLHAILANKEHELADANKKLLDKTAEARQLSAMIQAYKIETRKVDALMLAQDDQVISKQAQNEKALQESRATLQSYSLDAKEKESLITSLGQELANKDAAMASASQQAAVLEEKLAALTIKQEAIKAVITQRDEMIAQLQSTLDQAKEGLSGKDDERTALRATNHEMADKIAILQSQLRSSHDDAARMKEEIETVRKELITAHEQLTEAQLTSERCIAKRLETKNLPQE